MDYEGVIGLEVHAELETRSKMFCACPVVDPTRAAPNIAVCPICTGMPGVLPVVNQQAVFFALKVALALECTILPSSIFARKNYFYPDLPKGYQISQYEEPLARNGRLLIVTSQGEKEIRIRRVHLEEDTGKLTHVNKDGISRSLVDLNRAGVPLLEIVTEPDLHNADEVRAYATGLRSVLRYLGVNSGDMQKGVLRIEPNISIRPRGSSSLGTRVEIKNLNSFSALERSVAYEIDRQVSLLSRGEQVIQETLGWDDIQQITVRQRVKEGEDDYRYFPEPDLPPLVIEDEWIVSARISLPELPIQKIHRFINEYSLSEYDANVLVSEKAVAEYFEATNRSLEALVGKQAPPKSVANWITGELFGLLNQAGITIEQTNISPGALAELIALVQQKAINLNTAKSVLSEMFTTGKSAGDIVKERGYQQISDIGAISQLVSRTLENNPEQVAEYFKGKETISRWLFGQVMREAKGQANPEIVQNELDRQLMELRGTRK
jgi:aspartyl-tRNA(Asn)/glutamyl-tRNA(Gln) amidotransferase subunit B